MNSLSSSMSEVPAEKLGSHFFSVKVGETLKEVDVRIREYATYAFDKVHDYYEFAVKTLRDLADKIWPYERYDAVKTRREKCAAGEEKSGLVGKIIQKAKKQVDNPIQKEPEKVVNISGATNLAYIATNYALVPALFAWNNTEFMTVIATTEAIRNYTYFKAFDGLNRTQLRNNNLLHSYSGSERVLFKGLAYSAAVGMNCLTASKFQTLIQVGLSLTINTPAVQQRIFASPLVAKIKKSLPDLRTPAKHYLAKLIMKYLEANVDPTCVSYSNLVDVAKDGVRQLAAYVEDMDQEQDDHEIWGSFRKPAKAAPKETPPTAVQSAKRTVGTFLRENPVTVAACHVIEDMVDDMLMDAASDTLAATANGLADMVIGIFEGYIANKAASDFSTLEALYLNKVLYTSFSPALGAVGVIIAGGTEQKLGELARRVTAAAVLFTTGSSLVPFAIIYSPVLIDIFMRANGMRLKEDSWVQMSSAEIAKGLFQRCKVIVLGVKSENKDKKESVVPKVVTVVERYGDALVIQHKKVVAPKPTHVLETGIVLNGPGTSKFRCVELPPARTLVRPEKTAFNGIALGTTNGLGNVGLAEVGIRPTNIRKE